MAKDKTRKRVRRLRYRARSLGPDGWPTSGEPSGDERPNGDLDGGAGVREPRHPRPTVPAAALALDEPEPQYLALTR